MKLEKPGPKKKTKPKSKRIQIHDIEKPERLHCRKCGRTTQTEAFRHLETFRKYELGKGTGQKCNDKGTAYLCMDCDLIMSTKPDKADLLAVMTHAEEWNWLILKTWVFV